MVFEGQYLCLYPVLIGYIHVDGSDVASVHWVKIDILIIKHLQLAISVDSCRNNFHLLIFSCNWPCFKSSNCCDRSMDTSYMLFEKPI